MTRLVAVYRRVDGHRGSKVAQYTDRRSSKPIGGGKSDRSRLQQCGKSIKADEGVK